MKNTKEERIEGVKSALAINAVEGLEPSKECKEMLKDYIKGTSTIEENINKIIETYKEKGGNT